MTNYYYPPANLVVLCEYCSTAGFYIFILLFSTHGRLLWKELFSSPSARWTEYIRICFTHLNRRYNYVCIFMIFYYYSFFPWKKMCVWCNHCSGNDIKPLQNTTSCSMCIMFCVYRQSRTPESNLSFFLVIIRNSRNKHKYFQKV